MIFLLVVLRGFLWQSLIALKRVQGAHLLVCEANLRKLQLSTAWLAYSHKSKAKEWSRCMLVCGPKSCSGRIGQT